MAPQDKWETFSGGDGGSNDDETLSLSDLPVKGPKEEEDMRKPSETLEDFEFLTCGNGVLLKEAEAADMCPADDIFYRGQLLPLRPQSEPSVGFSSGRSLSSNSSSSLSSGSTCISRSQSCSSHSSNCDAPRLSVSNKFYAHPSPRPQVRTNVGPGRKSTSSAPPGWAVFRLGVAKVPEIELTDLRLRRLRSMDGKCEAKVINKPVPRFGFGCKCASDVCEPVPISSARPLISKKKKEKREGMGIGLERRESVCRSSRMFDWLEELSIGKGSALG